MLKLCAARVGSGGRRQKKRKMNIKLYYIILYIILYIYIVINIVPVCTNATPFFAGVLFFLIVRVESVFAFPHPPAPSLTLPQNFHRFANPQCLPNKIKHLIKFSMARSRTRLQQSKNSQKTLTILST